MIDIADAYVQLTNGDKLLIQSIYDNKKYIVTFKDGQLLHRSLTLDYAFFFEWNKLLDVLK